MRRILLTLATLLAVTEAVGFGQIPGSIGFLIILTVVAIAVGPIRMLRLIAGGLLMLVSMVFKLLSFAW